MSEMRQAYKLLAEALNIVSAQIDRHEEEDWMQKHRLVVAQGSIRGAMEDIEDVMERGFKVQEGLT